MAADQKYRCFGYESFEQLYQAKEPKVRRELRRILRDDQATIDDVAQEAFLRIVKKADGWQPQGASFDTFLYRVTRHLIGDVLRAREKQRELYQELRRAAGEEPLDPEKIAAQEEERGIVREKVQELPAEQRRVLEAKVNEDLDNHEIAEQLGKNKKTVGVLAYQGRKLLARKLAPYR